MLNEEIVKELCDQQLRQYIQQLCSFEIKVYTATQLLLNDLKERYFKQYVENLVRQSVEETKKQISLMTEKLSKACIDKICQRSLDEKKKQVLSNLEKSLILKKNKLSLVKKTIATNILKDATRSYLRNRVIELLIELKLAKAVNLIKDTICK